MLIIKALDPQFIINEMLIYTIWWFGWLESDNNYSIMIHKHEEIKSTYYVYTQWCSIKQFLKGTEQYRDNYSMDFRNIHIFILIIALLRDFCLWNRYVLLKTMYNKTSRTCKCRTQFYLDTAIHCNKKSYQNIKPQTLKMFFCGFKDL